MKGPFKMGLKENFSQAVKELTGNTKDDDKKRNQQVAGLRKALDSDQDTASQDQFTDINKPNNTYRQTNNSNVNNFFNSNRGGSGNQPQQGRDYNDNRDNYQGNYQSNGQGYDNYQGNFRDNGQGFDNRQGSYQNNNQQGF